MNRRFSISLGILAMAFVSLSPLAGQAPGTAAQKVSPSKAAAPANKALHTPWGEPDLQGVWNDSTSTPLQRPSKVGAKDVLSDEEAGEFQRELENNLTRDNRDQASTPTD